MPRIRDFGVTPGYLPPGPLNAITDVPGVRVGHTTIRRDVDGVPWRTGVTAIWPHAGNPLRENVYAAVFPLNGIGEVTARSVVDEWGLLGFPIVLTGTNHVGIVVLATDAPLSPGQCARLAKRAALGLARTGSTARDMSGEIMIAFATGNLMPVLARPEMSIRTLVEGPAADGISHFNVLFTGAVEATEEAVYNALVAAETVSGVDEHFLAAISHDRLRAILQP